jgi:hypothetical protein
MAVTYFERYLAGEQEQVWAEIVAVGAAVREEPLYSDALAVARETMRRARHNIELLVERLQAIGYRFGYAWLAKEGRFSKEAIAELEARVGTLPLSLRAWYEIVGTMDFVGEAPPSWDDLGDQGF